MGGRPSFELEQAFDLYNFIQEQVNKCDRQIEMHLIRYRAKLDHPSDDNFQRCKKKIGKKNAVDFDVEKIRFRHLESQYHGNTRYERNITVAIDRRARAQFCG